MKISTARGLSPLPQPLARTGLVLATLSVVLYGGSQLYVVGHPGLPLDDSWIHLQFAHELSRGAGLSYQDGVLMPGSTAPLWTALLSLGFLLPAHPVVWPWLLGVACFLATVAGSDRLAGELGCGTGTRRLAAVLVATSHWLVWSALAGMEINLFAALGIWGMVHHQRERRDPRRLPRSLPLLAAAALARPEGYLLFALAMFDRWLRPADDGADDGALRRGFVLPGKAWFTALAAAGLMLLPVLIFYRLFGGSFLPTTFSVKAAAPADLLPNVLYLRTVLSILFTSQPFMLLLAGVGILRLLAGFVDRGVDRGVDRRESRDHSALPAFWLLGLPLAYSFLTPENGPLAVGNFGRYYFPLLPVVVVLGVYGLEPLYRRLPEFLRSGPALALGLFVLFAPQIQGLLVGPLRFTQTVANVEDSDVAAARWLADRLPPDALLAVQDIGALKFHLPNPVLDLAGLVNPEILPVLREGPDSWEDRLLLYLEEKRPDYLVVFPRFYPRLVQSPGFEPVQVFRVRDNVTMAGDELVVFKTPWCKAHLAPLDEGAS